MFCPSAIAETLVTYTEPASPHLTAIQEKRWITDDELRQRIVSALEKYSGILNGRAGFSIIETAGGVHSPSMSGSLQSDVYRTFRFPIVLIGDSQLGGISTTLTAYESLRMRGYDIPCVVMLDNPRYKNQDIIQKHLDKETAVFVIPAPPPLPVNMGMPESDLDKTQMAAYYESIDALSSEMAVYVHDSHMARLNRINSMAMTGESKLWWPFTQHGTIKSTLVIDSAFGDDLTVFNPALQQSQQLFDACGSWWTQGVGHGHVRLAKAASYAAGRYGHVIFPESVHEPAMKLAERLLDTSGKGWASRVFYTDDGSTAIEVALKMAFKTTVTAQKLDKPKLDIVGVRGSYHGDTIGAMNASDPNVYNQQVDWYTGRGVWFDPPTVVLKNGQYHIRLPESISAHVKKVANASNVNNLETTQIHSRDDVFDICRNGSPLALAYRSYIETVLDQGERQGRVFGALLIEPILMGAGGMLWVDPLFQRELVLTVRQRSPQAPMPVIFDEIFVGMYRLGFASPGCSLLHVYPDIACYAKCLTGIVPLAATLARESVFGAFRGESKIDALLHGHSFTAHPVGCQVAVESINLLEGLVSKAATIDKRLPDGSVQSKQVVPCVWDGEILTRISALKCVDGVVPIGTVLAIELSASEKGYASHVSSDIVQKLRSDTNINIFTRPLGNVIYFMATHETPAESIQHVLKHLHQQLLKQSQS
ncbi:hypothetical protein BSLG_006839 [Batrachochytrium salamandrivorans]|nr:hypothetical protein BSLG_006839 [Batrachochytrium salamandrivorans]